MEGSIFFRLMEKLEGLPTDMKVRDTFGKCLEYKVRGGYTKYREGYKVRGGYRKYGEKKRLIINPSIFKPSTVPSATHANIYKKLFLPLRLSQFSWEV